MNNPVPRHRQNGTQEWLSALFTLLVLTGIYGSMDSFSSYSPREGPSPPSTQTGELSSVAPPYWNMDLNYGFRSVAGDTYTASGNQKVDRVIITSSGNTTPADTDLRVSYFKDTPIDQIDSSLDPGSTRAYSRLSHGIAVIEGDLESASAKTIFSTLHSR